VIALQVPHVEAVEQLRSELDQLQQQLQQAQNASYAAAQQANQERAAKLLAQQQQHNMQQELKTLRQLAQHIAQQLQAPQQTWQQQQQQLPAEPGRETCQSIGGAAGACPPAAAGPAQAFLSECQQLRQQLQQFAAVANTGTGTGTADSTNPTGSHLQMLRQQQLGSQPQEQQQQCDEAADLLRELELGDAAAAAVLASDPLQQLRAAVLGLSPGDASYAARPGMATAAAAAAATAAAAVAPAGLYRPGPSPCAGLWGAAGASQERLRQAYQQMLRQVQARYQQEQRQSELQHQQVGK
jgi:hypothetical protein